MSDIQHRLMVAAKDRRLRGEELRVIIVLHGWLSAQEFLPLRPSALAREMYVDTNDPRPISPGRRTGLLRALKTLVARGYLVPGPRQQKRGKRRRGEHRNGVPTFRLATPPLCSTGATILPA